MKLNELFETEEKENPMRNILVRIRNNPDSAIPWVDAMNLVLAGDKTPGLEAIIKSGVKSGFIDEFANFMSHADDKTFKKYSYLLTPEIKERFKRHGYAGIKLKKFERTKAEIKADKTHDTFIFVGADKFEKTADGKYERTLDIESFIKIDKYNAADLQTISMLKMRAHTREGAHVYIIKLPAGFIKSKVTHKLEPWLLKTIDDHKERI